MTSWLVLMTTVSLLGGLLASILVTSMFRVLTDGFPPPTTAAWERYVGRVTLGRFELPGALAVHLLVGTFVGGLLPVVLTLLGVPRTYLTTLPQTFTAGLVYGVSMYVVARGLQMVAHVDLAEGDRSRLLFDFHVLYGVVLGAWLGVARWVGFPLLCLAVEALCTTG